MSTFDDDDGYLDPNESGGLWEYQLHPLNVAWLCQALAGLEDDLAVEVELYDGSGALRELRPMHIDLRGFDRRAEAVVIVVH